MEPVPHSQPASLCAHPLLGVILPHDRLYLESQLGSGGFSVVFQGVHVRTGCAYAVKATRFAPAGTPLNAQQKAEACLHTRVSGHPHIVTLHKYFLHEHAGTEYLILILDLVRGPCLRKLICAGYFTDQPQLLRHFFGQMLNAVSYCHSKGIYHRDLKPENFLCSEDFSTVYLADFGLATVELFYRHVELGSPAYMSPEVACCADASVPIHSPGVDVWSLGILLLEALTGRVPWQFPVQDDTGFSLFKLNPSALFASNRLPVNTETLLRGALTCDPRARVSLQDFRATFLLDEESLMLSSIDPSARLLDYANLSALASRISPGLTSDSGSVGSSECVSLNTPSALSSQDSLSVFRPVCKRPQT